VKKVLVLNKKEGETPLETLESFRARHKEYKNEKMTYAGRLDPMASGLLLVLAGEKCKQKEKYLALNKEYEFEVLFGFATDTYDILGKVVSARQDLAEDLVEIVDEKEVKKQLKFFTGKFTQKYPAYSSKTVKGKALFAYARDGEEVETPEREVEVKSLKYLGIRKIKSEILLQNIEKRISKVDGDFRQKEILKIWQKKLTPDLKKENTYHIAKFKIKCSSGTYVRSIANSLGEKIKTPALAFSIKRTKLGKWFKLV